MTVLGILLILIGLALLIIRPSLRTENKYKTKNPGTTSERQVLVGKQSHPLLLMFSGKKLSFGMVIGGLFLVLMPYLFFFAERGYNYLLVSPTGNMSAQLDQGIKWRGFAKIDVWQKYIDVKVVSDETESDVSELEGVMAPIPIRFIDQVICYE